MRRLRSASARFCSTLNSEAAGLGAAASACCSSTFLDSQPLDICLFYDVVSKTLHMGQLLSSEAIDYPGVDAEIALEAAGRSAGAGLEGGSRPGWRDPKGDVRVEVIVAADTKLKGGTSAILPKTEVDRRN